MEDAMIKARTTLAPENLKGLQFIKNSSDYAYIKKINGADVWMRGNLQGGEEREFLTIAQLNERMRKSSLDTFKVMPAVVFNNENYVVSLKGIKYSLNSNNDKFEMLDDSTYALKTNAARSSSGFYAYLLDKNLFVSRGNDIRQLTTDGSDNIVYASSVHQNEWGIEKGIFWSNAGNNLAFYRMDQSMIKDYPIIDWTTNPAKSNQVKYPMTGKENHIVTVGVYDVNTKKTIWLNTPTPANEHFLTNIAWSPDDKQIYIAVVNRAQNEMWLNVYDAATGGFVKTIFTEKDDKYVEPLHPVVFLPKNSNQFIWESRRDGWNHFYLYDTNGKLIKQLTKGKWEVLDNKGFDAKGENIFFMASEASPVTKNLYLVNIKTGKIRRLTKEDGVHNVILSDDKKTFIDSYSTISNPKTIQLTDVASGRSKTLLQSKNPLADYSLGDLSLFTIRNKAGDDLYCRLYKPVGFDSTKKYPVIVYWYGGPHAQLILNSWNGGASDYWFQYLAERGYVVFTLDTRGSASRGKAFEQVIHRRTGDAQLEDMNDAVNWLKARPYVDAGNMGLFGWSYGGFMTTNYLTTYPGVFKAGVAGGPVIDWEKYEIMYGERYMDTPQENPEGFAATNLNKKAKNLKDHLLLIHGMQDPVVVMQHSVEFVKSAVDAGVQVDYMIYPGHEHNVLGKDRAHLYQKVTDYFELYLK